MAMRHLGPRFDIHTGGEDNVFPHHEDEIAQSAPIVGGPPAALWVHGAFLLMAGRKMAKSAGNFLRITELEAAGQDPLAFRYLCFTARYARQLDYSGESLHAAATALATLRQKLRNLGPAPVDGPWAAPPVLVAGRAPDRPIGSTTGILGHAMAAEGGLTPGDPPLIDRSREGVPPLSNTGIDLRAAFVAAVEDDLDLPTALGIVHAIVRADIPADERRWLILDADAILGLDLHRSWVTKPLITQSGAVERVAAERTAARGRQDWAEADRLRERLRELGFEVVDRTDGGTDLRPLGRS